MANQKSIVLVPFPYSDLSGKKVRPALIVSNPKFNEHEDVIICALTSSIKKRPFSLTIDSKDTVHKNLRDESQISVDTLTRIKKELIIKEIDVLDENIFQKILEILNSMFSKAI